MLIESDRNVEEISRACGFTDIRYFRRLLKRHEGMTPLAFRRLYAQMHLNTQNGRTKASTGVRQTKIRNWPLFEYYVSPANQHFLEWSRGDSNP